MKVSQQQIVLKKNVKKKIIFYYNYIIVIVIYNSFKYFYIFIMGFQALIYYCYFYIKYSYEINFIIMVFKFNTALVNISINYIDGKLLF